MDASAMKNNTLRQPKPLWELLPCLSGVLSKDAMMALSAKKQPRTTMHQARTAEKVLKPLNLAEMKAEILALRPQTSQPKGTAQSTVKRKGWNSSVKVDKKISHTAQGQLKNTTVRKVLNFQPKPKAAPNPRMTFASMNTPKFQKPEFRAKKANYLQDKNNVRISGICNIPQTPLEAQKPAQKKVTTANKENNSPCHSNMLNVVVIPPTPKLKKPVAPKVDTPLANSSWKSGSDASFLQKEKEIHEIEEKIKALAEESTLENIADVSPPVSTPFKEYRSVQDYFNNSSYLENSALYNDNTIMCFDKPSICAENDKKEESVIISLCDMFNKATVNNEKIPTELESLLEVEKETENNIKMLDNGIKMLTKIKEAQEKSLQNVKKLINEKKSEKNIPDNGKDKTLVSAGTETKDFNSLNKTLIPEKSPILSRPRSVIKSSRSPSYKIPKKNLALRKSLVTKSMATALVQTPVKDFEGKAFTMYMKMKEQMNFLSTPLVNRNIGIPDTPAVTSHNLQKQLDKLFGS